MKYTFWSKEELEGMSREAIGVVRETLYKKKNVISNNL